MCETFFALCDLYTALTKKPKYSGPAVCLDETQPWVRAFRQLTEGLGYNIDGLAWQVFRWHWYDGIESRRQMKCFAAHISHTAMLCFITLILPMDVTEPWSQLNLEQSQ